MFEQLFLLLIGFSVIGAAILFIAYAFFLSFASKTWDSLASCFVLLLALSILQIGHLNFILSEFEPLESWAYLLPLFAVPPMFYFFSRSVIMPTAPKRPYLLLNLLPLALIFLFPNEIALPLLFLIGTAYSLWFVVRIYGVRRERKSFRFEIFFFSTFSIMAIGVLIFGFAIPYIDNAFFYYFYGSSIGLAFVLVVAALIGFPELINEISESARIKYAASTLIRIDKKAALQKLDEAMKAQ